MNKDAYVNVNRPAHYTEGRIECIDAMEAAVTGLEGMDAVLTAQVMKYIWRWKKKNGVEDLRKAEWYLKRLIAQVEGQHEQQEQEETSRGIVK